TSLSSTASVCCAATQAYLARTSLAPAPFTPHPSPSLPTYSAKPGQHDFIVLRKLVLPGQCFCSAHQAIPAPLPCLLAPPHPPHSDKPGQHDFNVLRKLVLPDGSVLRAKLPGRPTRDCLFADPARDHTSMLKIWMMNACSGMVGAFNCPFPPFPTLNPLFPPPPSIPNSMLKIWTMNACSGMVGAFNCQGAGWCRDGRKYTMHNPDPDAVTGTVAAADVDLLADVAASDWTGDVAVFSHNAGGCAEEREEGEGGTEGGELVRLPADTSLVVHLHRLEFELYTVAPITVVGSVAVAPIGLTNMYNSGGAVLSVRSSNTSGAGTCATSPDAAGAGSPNADTTEAHKAAAREADAREPGAGAAEATVEVEMRGGGSFVLYASKEPLWCTVDGTEAQVAYTPDDGRAAVQVPFRAGATCLLRFAW
ncbi:unnamed protein product, partial [Closterium sp. Naga37s-1]